ncbi:hypothetical protein MMC25_007417 [Agyrium rufum]|nr:hypothetical protein [Agyrium rufum]
MAPKVKQIAPTNPVARDSSILTYITLDGIARVLNSSLFHPFVCGVFLLSLRGGLEVPWSDPACKYTLYWTIFVAAWSLLEPLSERYAWGAAREVDLEEEVIVVTGGASGLGRCIAEVYALRGASVAVIDKMKVNEGDGATATEGVCYQVCDVTDKAQVEKAWEAIKKELGTPTVLINSAAIVNGKSFVDLTPEDAEKTFATNVLSQYRLNSLFLPPLLTRPNGGTLVTISSVLGSLGASHLSDYTASKAALRAYHISLTAELARSHPQIKTILATPGQLSTDLFRGVRLGPVANFFGAEVDVQVLATRLVKMIDGGQGGVVSEPFYARWVAWLDVLPWGVQKVVRDLSGIDGAMEGFGKGE